MNWKSILWTALVAAVTVAVIARVKVIRDIVFPTA
jgi:hypothetical protein